MEQYFDVTVRDPTSDRYVAEAQRRDGVAAVAAVKLKTGTYGCGVDGVAMQAVAVEEFGKTDGALGQLLDMLAATQAGRRGEHVDMQNARRRTWLEELGVGMARSQALSFRTATLAHSETQ